MEGSMLEEEIEIYSEKYGIHGMIRDYGVLTKLSFNYDGREIEMVLDRRFLGSERLGETGRKTMESYIASLAPDGNARKLQLHYWYIEEHEYKGGMYRFGHGIVTGHSKLPDSVKAHTSAIRAVHIDDAGEELVMTTQSSVYHCPLAYCDFDRQDGSPDIILGYEELKGRYKSTMDHPSIEPGKVLLVLANFCDYYFHSLYYVPEGAEGQGALEYHGFANIGTFQDSFIIGVDGDHRIDIRYFPHFQNITFYKEQTAGLPLYIENIGDVVLYADTHAGMIRLDPGERKEAVAENAEADPPVLPGGDLYPAAIL